MNDHMNRKVLVVDDQESIREDFKKILIGEEQVSAGLKDARNAFFGEVEQVESSVEYELHTASQGLEGIDVLRAAVEAQDPFAMAFVDVRMPPGIDGLQTIKGLWELDPDLQVVICTAYSDYSFDEIIAELGQSDRLLILKKPFDPVEVRQLAGALTEKWNMIHRLKLQMDELREANQRAESANRAKSEFLANMSHEIRTPMNALLGYVGLMCDPGATLEQRGQYGRTIRKSGEHLLTILNDILDISRIEASRLVVNSSDFCPFDLVHEIVTLMSAQAYEKDLKISIEVDGAIPQVLESDLVRVRQILINLVGNAIKFTEEGSVRVVLRLDENTASDHRYLYIEVHDTGIGIEESQLEAIFDPFNQVDGSLTREYGGTGLGLTIAKRLALLLGGDIDATGTPGVGSKFTLKLYAGELGRALLREYGPAECEIGRQPVEQDEQELEDITLDGRVLVVEDVKFNQLLLGALLRSAGAEVELASDGKEGYEAAKKAEESGSPFELVLMDMQMPVMDGYEATRRLRSEGYPRPIIALTAHAMAGDREKCLDAGCDDYATKPLDKPMLLQLCYRMMALEKAGAPLPNTEWERSPTGD